MPATAPPGALRATPTRLADGLGPEDALGLRLRFDHSPQRVGPPLPLRELGVQLSKRSIARSSPQVQSVGLNVFYLWVARHGLGRVQCGERKAFSSRESATAPPNSRIRENCEMCGPRSTVLAVFSDA